MEKKYLIENRLYENNEKYEVIADLINQCIIYEEKEQLKVIIDLTNNTIIRENNEFQMTINFNSKKCTIKEKNLGSTINIDLEIIELFKDDKRFSALYKIDDSKFFYKITEL